MIKLLPVTSPDEVQLFRDAYRKELTYAQDLNIEENIWESDYSIIRLNDIDVGYVCIDSGKTLWEFYLVKSAWIYSQEIFRFLIAQNYITAAECKTYDYLLMSLCMDTHKSAEGSAYLFRDYTEADLPALPYSNITYRLASGDDYNVLSALNKIADGVDFFYDLMKEIEQKEVLVFYSGNQLLGAGTCKMIWDHFNYRDIGMVVAEGFRKQGIGTYILLKLKEYCLSNNQIPVAGCWYYHISSKKTLEKAGFLSKHRVIRFTFA